jgi:[ribosomal protein S18]-alanine N-acetyltransferase
MSRQLTTTEGKDMASEVETVDIRWLIRRDMADVLAIEADSFEFAWCEQTFVKCLRQRNTIGMVAERDGQVVGYMVYELHLKRLHLLNFAVAKVSRRQGVGLAMVRKLVSKLSSDRRTRIYLEVRETNLAAQLFFKSCGFRAVGVLSYFYQDTSEDAYQMAYRYEGAE